MTNFQYVKYGPTGAIHLMRQDARPLVTLCGQHHPRVGDEIGDEQDRPPSGPGGYWCSNCERARKRIHRDNEVRRSLRTDEAPIQNVDTVRHAIFALTTPGTLELCCRIHEQEGFGLVRVVPYTQSEAVAVFERLALNDASEKPSPPLPPPVIDSEPELEPVLAKPDSVPVDRAMYDVKEACYLLGKISRTNLYKLINTHQLHPVKIGNRTFVTKTELQRYIDKLAS